MLEIISWGGRLPTLSSLKSPAAYDGGDGCNAMFIESLDEVRRLISSGVSEGSSLEFKQELTIRSQRERREALKDLTALGNAGGGALIYGISEVPDVEGKPSRIVPLSDRSLPSRLEDIALAGVRPPLVWDPVTFDLEDGSGFVFVANIRRSPLGPYMIEAYGDRRYHVRVGSRSVEMTEQQVRDSYALALRESELEETTWERYQLPMSAPSSDAWLIVSAVPRGPRVEVFSPSAARIDEIRPPEFIRRTDAAEFSHLNNATMRLSVWSDGIAGSYSHRPQDQPVGVFRFHRSAAAAIGRSFERPLASDGTAQPARLNPNWIARALNVYLRYLAWLWDHCDLSQAVVLDARLDHLGGTLLPTVSMFPEEHQPVQPPAAPEATVDLRVELLPWRLQDAAVRHRFVRNFSSRLYNAFGRDLFLPMFDMGWLYGADGFLHLSVTDGGVWTDQRHELGHIHESGTIRRLSGDPVALLEEGVVLDPKGNCLGALEFATGPAIPPEFFLRGVVDDPRPRVTSGGSGPRKPDIEPPMTKPTPTRRWSELSLSHLLQE